MIEAAAYARFSSQAQREESIDAQIRAINKFAQENGYQIVRTYTDHAQSARTDDRPEFQRMIEDAGSGRFSAIIVHKLDRFSRDRYDSAIYRRKLKRVGVTLISVLERLDDSPESVIMESILEGMAEYYSRNLAREVKKGLTENALKARHNGGIPPLGYRVNANMEYEIDPVEADTVRRIYNMRIEGHSYQSIAAHLNELGRLTKRGRPFSGGSSLMEILRNEKYTGVYVYNRRYKSHINGKSNMHMRRNEAEIIRIPDALPRIIDDETWRLVQMQLQSKKQASYKAREPYLLSGLAYCGKCGAKMHGNRRRSSTTGKSVYVGYYCSARCGGRGVSRDKLEGIVQADLRQRLFTADNAARIADKIMEIATEERQYLPRRINEARKLYDEADRQIRLIIDAIGKGAYCPEMNDQLKMWGDRKDALKEELDEMEGRAENLDLATREKLIEYLLHQSTALDKGGAAQQKVILRFIKKVVINDEDVTIQYKIDDPSSSTPGLVRISGRGEPIYLIRTVVPLPHFFLGGYRI